LCICADLCGICAEHLCRYETSDIDHLRTRTVAYRLGALFLTGLRGNATVPKQTGASTASWLSDETTVIAESQPTLGQLSLTAKNVAALTDVSHQMAVQASPAVEALVLRGMAADLAVAVDAAVINGSGASGQPTGILQTSGIGSVSGTSLTYDTALEFQSDVLAANALVNPATCGYVAPVATAKLLANRQKFSGTDATLWSGNLADGQLAGFPAMSSEHVPASHLLFGDWSSILVAEWGVLELMTNPFQNFATGVIGVRAIWSVDIGLRYAASFSRATAVT
jgi:HK97 family phage major capsid protein